VDSLVQEWGVVQSMAHVNKKSSTIAQNKTWKKNV
jgi:hypothetical protein